MPPTKFDILDKAARASGEKLSAKDLGGAPTKKLRDELGEAGFLKTTGKTVALTSEGWAEWRKHAPAERIAEFEQAKKQKAAKQLSAFLQLVEERKGGALTQSQASAHPESARSDAIQNGYVRQGKTATVFELLPKGTAFLLAQKPFEEQVAVLKQHVRSLFDGVRDGHLRLKAEIDAIGQGAEPFASIQEVLQRDATTAGEQFTRVVDELAGFGRLIEAARQFKQTVEIRVTTATKALGAAPEKTNDLRQDLSNRLSAEANKLANVERELTQRIESLTQQTKPQPTAITSPPATPVAPVVKPNEPAVAPAKHDGPVTSERLRESLKKAYDHLCLFQEFQNKLVELPRLYHETKKLVPTLTPQQFHEELEVLKSEWKVELHILNEVAMAKERELAIWKNDRLYYYAFWK